MASSPGLSEIATTTRRHRSVKDNLMREDKAAPKKKGIAPFKYANPVEDRRKGIRATVKSAVADAKKGKK